MEITFHLHTDNPKGVQELDIVGPAPSEESNEVTIKLRGEYKGEQIQIDFTPIPKETLKSNLKALAEAL